MNMKIDKVSNKLGLHNQVSLSITRKTADLLEKSEYFERTVKYLRGILGLPPNGIRYKEWRIEGTETKLETKLLETIVYKNKNDLEFNLYDFSFEFAVGLGLAPYWYISLYNFVIYNIFFAPERDIFSIYPAEYNRKTGESLLLGGVEIVINEKISKTQLHKLIDFNWKKIEKYMEELGEMKIHRKTSAETMKRIEKMKDEEDMHFSEIADLLQKENVNSPNYDAYNEPNIKAMYYRWKKRKFPEE